MNVFDFDNTIYDGESAFDFFVFCARKYPRMIKFFPRVISVVILYKLCRITREGLLDRMEKYDAEILTGDKSFADLFEAAAAICGKPTPGGAVWALTGPVPAARRPSVAIVRTHRITRSPALPARGGRHCGGTSPRSWAPVRRGARARRHRAGR